MINNSEMPHVVSVKELLRNKELTIPEYQRPYKWTERNVNQLIDDILSNTEKSAYRVGTLVVHRDIVNGKTIDNIVDGQQRTITIVLIAYALINSGTINYVINRENSVESFSPKIKLVFSNIISQENIINNYRTIMRRINEFDEKNIRYFYNHCEFVQVTLKDVSEAFQFFDSQNARGKDLEPHDLLKAFHLREMNNLDEKDITQAVEKWEKYDTNELSRIFATFLFRIRNWSRGLSARYFTKDDIDCFKGINICDDTKYPFSQIYRIANYYTDDYNGSVFSKVTGEKIDFPFQIDQTIINGKLFFDMVSHYVETVRSIEGMSDHEILKMIKEYEGHVRTGDEHVKNLFYCGLMYYIDKFGKTDIDRAIKKVFVWAYSLRMILHSIGIDSIDNYALNTYDYTGLSVQLFRRIRDALSPKEILNMPLAVVRQNKSTKTQEIEDKLSKLNYYERNN